MHRFISTLSTIILGLGCFAGTGFAANLTDKSIGISIELDDALVNQSSWRGYRVFSSADNAASVFIRPAPELSMYHLREDLKGEGAGFDDVGSVDLIVTGEIKNAQVGQGSGIMVPVKGRIAEYKVRGMFGGYAGFDDQKFFVIVAARPDYLGEWAPRFSAMLDSIRFVKVDYSEMISNWYKQLNGKRLVPDIPADSGITGPQPINLCRNGIVAEKKPANPQPATPQQQTVWNGFAWVTVPVAPMPPPPPARWLIEPIMGKPILVIRQGPRPTEYLLEMQDDQLSLSGKPYRIADSTLCPSEPARTKRRQ